jgi:hypothetical protein
VLVQYFGQSQLNWLIKAMIAILIIISILSIITDFRMVKTILIIILGLTLINLVLYFVLFNKIQDIEKSHIKHIESLKNYALAYIISVFGKFGLSILIEFNNSGLKFISHFLIIIPTIFITIFFNSIKNDEFKNAST